MYKSRIFDRGEDGDFDITGAIDLVGQMVGRKSATFSERQIFPYAAEADLRLAELMPKVRKLIAIRNEDHPWLKMTDTEILRSAGLYEENRAVERAGFNLAAILLFGKDDVIRSCTANYVTDCIVRRENLDRYDHRVMVSTNLIDAYDEIFDFISKWTMDRFCLDGDLSISARSHIARELVSNTLTHREYTSALPAKVIITNDAITTENWSRSQFQGKIDPASFTPYPKNPVIARFFINIGRADTLGSGVRSLYKYSRMYSGKDPQLIEGDVFKTIVPLSLSDERRRKHEWDM